MVRDLVEIDEVGQQEPDEQTRSLDVFRLPSRPNVSVDELLAASIGQPPYDNGIRKDYRPIMQLFVDAMLQLPGETWQERWARGADGADSDRAVHVGDGIG